jgi:hypothetical protein
MSAGNQITLGNIHFLTSPQSTNQFGSTKLLIWFFPTKLDGFVHYDHKALHSFTADIEINVGLLVGSIIEGVVIVTKVEVMLWWNPFRLMQAVKRKEQHSSCNMIGLK